MSNIKKYHILNGDCLAIQLNDCKVKGHTIVCRECLIEGDLTDPYVDFWALRATFIAKTYHATKADYQQKVIEELAKIDHIPAGSEVCLWFENDLFCQVNMWFILSLLPAHVQAFRVFPVIQNSADTWQGFGLSNQQMLEESYANKVKFEPQDILLGQKLWAAYKSNNFQTLVQISQLPSACFEYLEEVCQAHIDRFAPSGGRPQQVIQSLIATQPNDFASVFARFSAQEGIYGFGDLQVKTMYDQIMSQT